MNMVKAVTLEEYLDVTRKDLEDFEKYWKAQQQLAPEHFPQIMWHGNWDEQFDVFTQENLMDDDLYHHRDLYNKGLLQDD